MDSSLVATDPRDRGLPTTTQRGTVPALPDVVHDGQELDLVVRPSDSHVSVLAPEQRTPLDFDLIYQGCVQSRDDLLETANKYRKKANLAPIDLATAPKWNEVDEAVQSTCNDLEKLVALDKKATGATGRLKQAFRALCRHAGAGETLISLIPGDAFGFSSTLCAAFKVIFTAMHKMSVYREELFRALEELPSLLKDTSELCSTLVFKDNEDLHQRRAALYTAVFHALKQILFWFLKNSFVTSVKLIVDPSGFSDALKEHMDSVKLRSQLFQSQAMKLSLFLQAHSARLQHVTSEDVQNIAKKTEFIEAEAIRTRVATLELLEKIDSLARKSLNDNQPSKPRPRLTKRLRQGAPAAGIDQILRDYAYDDMMIPNDCDSVMKMLHQRRRRSVDDDVDEQRVLSIQSNPRVRAWIMLNQPSMLLLNGRSGSQQKSEVSIVAAKIANRLLELHSEQEEGSGKPLIIPLLYFCAQHRDWRRDPNGHPCELALSLLLQLLDHGRSSITAEALRGLREQTNPEDINAICSSIQKVINSLPQNVFVVIMIDGLKFFAQPEERQEMTKVVISNLVSMYRRGATAILKLLFTSPTRLESFEELFEDDEILNMVRDLPAGKADNDRAWKRPIDLPALGAG